MDHDLIKKELSKTNKVILYAAIGIILVVVPHLMPNNYWLRIYAMTGLFVMLALGLNVVAGFAGLLDLAYVAFFGIGGYTFAFLSSNHFDIHLPFLLVLPLSALITMGFGFALGASSMRLKGDYLAIVTLAFAQIFKLLLLNLDRPINITGGVNGIYNFDPISILGLKKRSTKDWSDLAKLLAERRLSRTEKAKPRTVMGEEAPIISPPEKHQKREEDMARKITEWT